MCTIFVLPAHLGVPTCQSHKSLQTVQRCFGGLKIEFLSEHNAVSYSLSVMIRFRSSAENSTNIMMCRKMATRNLPNERAPGCRTENSQVDPSFHADGAVIVQ